MLVGLSGVIKVKYLFIIIMLAVSATSAFAQPVPYNIKYYEKVTVKSLKKDKTLDVSFHALGRDFNLKLKPRDPFLPNAKVRWVGSGGVVEEPVPTGIFFSSADSEKSWARITLQDDNAMSGIVSVDGERYGLEPASRFFAAAPGGTGTIAYRMADVDMGAIATSCGVVDSSTTSYATNPKSLAASGPQKADMSLVADFEYYNSNGANSAVVMSDILNSVDGIYQSELGVTVQIGQITVFTTPDDPFTSTIDPMTLLQEMGAWRNAHIDDPSGPVWDTDLTHLFTGRVFSSTIIGIAYLGSLCDGTFSVGVDRNWTTSLSLMSMLLAHEMGHNFGAPHDNQAGSVCGYEPGTFIMNPVISPSLQRGFSPCSKVEIGGYVSSVGCFESAFLDTPVVTVPLSGQFIGVEGVTFTWNPVIGASLYDMQIVSSDGSIIFSGTLSGNTSTSTLIGIPNDGDYTFLVRACVDSVSDATCGYFAERNFSVRLIAPTDAPVITFPPQGIILMSSQQLLRWTTVENNPFLPDLFYEVKIMDRLTGLTEWQFRTIDPVVQANVVFRSGAYTIQVRACQAGCGPVSNSVDFSVVLAPVPTVAPTIADATVVNGNTLTARWSAVSGAEWYQVQVVQPRPAGPGGGALTVASRMVAGDTDVTLAVPMGQAAVFVAACNGDGCGPKSQAVTINPAGPNPSSPHMGSPLDGSVANGPMVLFTWSRIPGDTGNVPYRLYVQDLSRQRAALDVITTQNFYSALLNANGSKYGAVVIAGPENAGPPISFSVQGVSPMAPTLMTPTHTSTVPAGNVLLGWTPISGASLYEYLVSVQGEAQASGRGVTTGTFVQVPLTAVNGQPTVYSGIVRDCPLGQVCAFGSEVGWGPWSTVAGSGSIAFMVQ